MRPAEFLVPLFGEVSLSLTLFYYSSPFLSVCSFCLFFIMHIGQSTVDITKVDGLNYSLMSSNILGIF